jgi:hypothetical protein
MKNPTKTAIESIQSALNNLDNFIGEREVYEELNPYTVGRVTAADAILRDALKELSK